MSVPEASSPRRASVGFQGGQVLPLRIAQDALDGLRRALEEGRDRWHPIETVDGAILVDLGQVVYLRTESDEQRVGF